MAILSVDTTVAAAVDPEKGRASFDRRRYSQDRKNPELGIGDQDVLHRKLKGWHMQMIAISGSISTGLFVGSDSALQSSGPASLIIDFIIISIMLFFTVHALGELAVLFPVSGTFYSYSVRFLDPVW